MWLFLLRTSAIQANLIALGLASDTSASTSRWTLLPLVICFQSLGRIGGFHPLEHGSAGRTMKKATGKSDGLLYWMFLNPN